MRAVNVFDKLIIAVYDRPLKTLLFSPEERISLAKETFADITKIQVTGYSKLSVDACREADAIRPSHGRRFPSQPAPPFPGC